MLEDVTDMFKKLKEGIKSMSPKELQETRKSLAEIGLMAEQTGQQQLLLNIQMQAEFNSREANEALPAGYTKWLNLEDIDEAIDAIKEANIRHILMNDIKNYIHPIPKEHADKIEEAKKVFDKIYIVHTDYSGKDRKLAEDIKREKDPIALGSFVYTVPGTRREVASPHMYFITDWEDEYDDLTLDKLFDEYREASSKELSLHDADEILTKLFEVEEDGNIKRD